MSSMLNFSCGLVSTLLKFGYGYVITPYVKYGWNYAFISILTLADIFPNRRWSILRYWQHIVIFDYGISCSCYVSTLSALLDSMCRHGTVAWFVYWDTYYIIIHFILCVGLTRSASRRASITDVWLNVKHYINYCCRRRYPYMYVNIQHGRWCCVCNEDVWNQRQYGYRSKLGYQLGVRPGRTESPVV